MQPPPLPPPSAAPTEPLKFEVQTPEPEPGSKRGYVLHSEEKKAAALARLAEGRLTQKEVAAEFGVHQTNISRWLIEAKLRRATEEREATNVAAAKRHRGGKHDAYPQEYKDKIVQKAIGYGRGGQARVARETGLTEATISLWSIDYKKRNKLPPSSRGGDTLMSSGPVSKVTNSHRRPAAAVPALPPFLQGLDEYIEQIVDARVEEAVKRILRTTSLMELMKQ